MTKHKENQMSWKCSTLKLGDKLVDIWFIFMVLLFEISVYMHYVFVYIFSFEIAELKKLSRPP